MSAAETWTGGTLQPLACSMHQHTWQQQDTQMLRLHLGLGVDGVQLAACVRVPEADGAVGSASPGGQQGALEGAPGQGLDSCRVGCQAVAGGLPCGAALGPHVEQVVVAPAGQLLPVGGPLEPAHLLVVACQHRLHVLADPAGQSQVRSLCQQPRQVLAAYGHKMLQFHALPADACR